MSKQSVGWDRFKRKQKGIARPCLFSSQSYCVACPCSCGTRASEGIQIECTNLERLATKMYTYCIFLWLSRKRHMFYFIQTLTIPRSTANQPLHEQYRRALSHTDREDPFVDMSTYTQHSTLSPPPPYFVDLLAFFNWENSIFIQIFPSSYSHTLFNQSFKKFESNVLFISLGCKCSVVQLRYVHRSMCFYSLSLIEFSVVVPTCLLFFFKEWACMEGGKTSFKFFPFFRDRDGANNGMWVNEKKQTSSAFGLVLIVSFIIFE